MYIRLHVKYPYSCPIIMTLEFSRRIFEKNTQMSNFIQFRPVRAELFHAYGRANRHDEANIHFSQFCERAKMSSSLSGQHKDRGLREDERVSIFPRLWMVSFTFRSLQLPGKVPRSPLASRLGKSQSQSGNFGADEDLLTVSGIVCSVSLSLLLPTLLRLKKKTKKKKEKKNNNKK